LIRALRPSGEGGMSKYVRRSIKELPFGRAGRKSLGLRSSAEKRSQNNVREKTTKKNKSAEKPA